MQKFSVFVATLGVLSSCSATTVTIGPISPDRWAEFRDLRYCGYTESPLSLAANDDEFVDPEKFYRGRLAAALKEEEMWLTFADVDGQVAGVVGAVCLKKNLPLMRHTAMIFSVYVRPEFRRQGIGEALMMDMIARLERSAYITQVHLYVLSTEERAIRLYERCGFTLCGTMQRNAYYNGTYYDQHVMERAIK